VPPIIYEKITDIEQTSPERKQAFVHLELLGASGGWNQTKFRVDSGATLTVMSWERFGPSGRNRLFDQMSERRKIDIILVDGTTVSTEGYTARFRAPFPTEPGWIFAWDALLVENGGEDTTPLLGIGGSILSDVNITFSGWTRQFPTFYSGTVSFDIQIPPNVQLPAIQAE